MKRGCGSREAVEVVEIALHCARTTVDGGNVAVPNSKNLVGGD